MCVWEGGGGGVGVWGRGMCVSMREEENVVRICLLTGSC